MALAIVGGGAAFLVLGVAAVSWRTQCEANPKAGFCFLSAPAAPGSVSSVVAKRAEPSVPAPAFIAEATPETVLTAAVTAPVVEAAFSEPSAGDTDLVAAAAMMSSTFATLSALSAEINGSDPAPDPLQTAVTATADAAAPALPAPPALAPAKRTVKLIPVSPTGTPVASAATAAIDAADQVDQSHAIALQQAAAVNPGAMAFATPAAAVAAGTPARLLEVNDNLVNVRAGPSTGNDRLFVLEEGDEVKQLAVAGDWVEIEDAEGRTGWMLGTFLADESGDTVVESAGAAVPPPTGPAEDDAAAAVAAAPAGGDIRRVIGGGVNVRSGASGSSEKLFALGPGEEVTVTETERGWLKVTDDQGRTGWLYEDFVSRG